MSSSRGTTATPVDAVVRVSPVTQWRVLCSEWIKFRSLRSTTLTLLSAVAAMLVISWVVGWATNAHWATMDPRERAHFNPIDRSLVGVNLAQLAIGVLGVLLISGEYATGMIRATLAAVPRRLPVLWAKTALFAVVTFMLMLASSIGAFLVGQHFLGTHGTTLSAPHAWRAVIGAAGYLTLVGALAVALGFLSRSTAGGIATLVALLLVLPGVGQVLPASWQHHTLPYLPSNAGSAMYAAMPDPAALSPGRGAITLLVWAVLALTLAAVALRRRDA